MQRVEPQEPSPGTHTATELIGLDHIALAAADPGAMKVFLSDHVGLRQLAGAAESTLVSADDDRCAQVRLFPAQGPREAGALARLVLRVSDLERAVAKLPDGIDVREEAPDLLTFEGPEGLGLGFALVIGGGVDYDIDHIALRVADPEETRAALAELGCVPRGEALHVRDKRIVLEELPAHTDRPLLDHIAFRVASAEAVAAGARARGLELADDAAAGTAAIVLPGPERITVHFVDAGHG